MEEYRDVYVIMFSVKKSGDRKVTLAKVRYINQETSPKGCIQVLGPGEQLWVGYFSPGLIGVARGQLRGGEVPLDFTSPYYTIAVPDLQGLERVIREQIVASIEAYVGELPRQFDDSAIIDRAVQNVLAAVREAEAQLASATSTSQVDRGGGSIY